MRRRLLILSSARPGGSEGRALDTACKVLAAAADVDLARTSSPASLQRALDRRSGRVPVVAGGDGSLHLVVQALHDRGELGSTPVGLLPLGTGNDLARAVGVPLEPAAAAAVVNDGHARALDLLLDEAGSVLLNAAHLGVGATASRLSARLKPTFGPVGYRLGSLLAGTTAEAPRLRVTVDGTVLADGDRPALMVAVGNGGTIGGGSPLLPAARLDDGVLDVMVSFATSPLARLRFGAALRKGRHVARSDVLIGTGRTVAVQGDAAELNVDGELAGRTSGRTWRLRSAAWRLLAPSGGH